MYFIFGFLEKRLLDGQIQITALQKVALLLENHETRIQRVNCAQNLLSASDQWQKCLLQPSSSGPLKIIGNRIT